MAARKKNNRQALIEGALTCLQERGYSDTRARHIAEASGANLGSIGYHFGSTDNLLGEALVEGFQRWRIALAQEFDLAADASPAVRIQRVAEGVRSSIENHRPLALAFLEAASRAPRSEALAELMARGYHESQLAVAALLGLGEDETALHTAALIIATFDGLLLHTLIDPDGAPTDAELGAAVSRLGELAGARSRVAAETRG